MIRKIFMALAFGSLAFVQPLTSQSGIGVVGGYVSSKVTEDPAVAGLTWAGRSGFVGGLSLGAGIAQGVSLGLEGLYVQKGSDAHISTASASEKLTYVEVPLLLRIAIGNPHRPHLFITGGGQYSFLMTCTTSVAGAADIDCKKASTDTSGIKSSDYGIVLGGGIASGRLSLSVRYDIGLANLNNEKSNGSGSISGGPTVFKSRAVMAMLGIALGK